MVNPPVRTFSIVKAVKCAVIGVDQISHLITVIEHIRVVDAFVSLIVLVYVEISCKDNRSIPCYFFGFVHYQCGTVQSCLNPNVIKVGVEYIKLLTRRHFFEFRPSADSRQLRIPTLGGLCGILRKPKRIALQNLKVSFPIKYRRVLPFLRTIIPADTDITEVT